MSTLTRGRPSTKVQACCASCGEKYYAKPSEIKNGRKYCSHGCYRQAITKKELCKCVECGNFFMAAPSRINQYGAKYCSRKCANTGASNKIIKKCKWCGKDFSVKRSRFETKFCSLECKNTSRRSQRIRTCTQCGKTYLGKARSKKQFINFCSKKCYGLYSHGENNGRWLGGVSFEPYCPKFNDEFKKRVREFFDNECVVCGKTKAEIGRNLSVHHVNYDKNTCCNEKPPRFAAVCNRHNVLANRDRDRWEYIFNYILEEMYDGKCFYSKEEFY